MSELARTDAATEVAQRTPQQQLIAEIRRDEFKEQIALALPPTVTSDRFVRVAITALLDKPEIATADRASVFAALLRCAQIGLMPDGREAAINVYRTKVKDASGAETWIPKAECLEMVGGYRKIAADHGWTLTARVVYAADEFDYEEGLEQRLEHRPARPGVDRGQRVAVYALSTKRGEQPLFRVLTPEDVARAKKSAKTDKIWNEHTDRMWEKTAAKLLFKSLPLGNLDERVLRLLTIAETEPADAAAAIYGPDARAAFDVNRATGELTERTSTPAEGPADGTDAGAAASDGAGQQVEGAADPLPTDAAPSAPDPAPSEFDMADEPTGESGFKVPEEAQEMARRAAAAYEAQFPSGVHTGRSIREVAELDPAYLMNALKKAKDETFRYALETSARVYLPETWERYEAWVAEQTKAA